MLLMIMLCLFSQPLQWMQDYVRDHWGVEYGYTLVPKTMHGNVIHPKEKSWTRNQVEPVDLRNSPRLYLNL